VLASMVKDSYKPINGVSIKVRNGIVKRDGHLPAVTNSRTGSAAGVGGGVGCGPDAQTESGPS
jgi:hypothetical protein